MIYDTFIFFNELDLLELRLNVLNQHVDYFVLVEATETFQGAPKPLHFAENKDRFSKFLDRIIHVVVDDMPPGASPFDREYFQRDCILRGLSNCTQDDLIILSDVDEIPNPEKIPETVPADVPMLFSQTLYYYKLNRRCLQLEILPCSVITHIGRLGNPSQLRKEIVALHSAMLANQELPDSFTLIDKGGWHFSYLGSAETIIKKIEAFAHAEYNLPEYKDINDLMECISQGRDLFGRDLAFVSVDLDELPEYVRDHREMYEALGYLELNASNVDILRMHAAYLRVAAELKAAEREVSETKSIALAAEEQARANIQSLQSQYEQAAELLAQMKGSKSWRLTMPLRFVARLMRYGMSTDDLQNINQRLRKIYHRMPLPGFARDGLRSLYRGYSNRARVAGSLSMAGVPFNLPALVPASRQEDFADYLMWGVIDWHFRFQRPQQLATALAASGRRVIYISPTFNPDARAGFNIEQLDTSGRLFQVKLFVSTAPTIYSQAPTAEELRQIHASLGRLLEWLNPRQVENIVQHPFWYGAAMALPNGRVVYDCMDHHDGFGNNATEISTLENTLIKQADLTITTSDWLDKEVGKLATCRALIRNAGDFAHFSKTPARIYRDTESRKIIGYYGAIAEWFDQELVEEVAKAFPECCVLLIGADSVNAQRRLGKLPNVKFTGEVSYQELPFYLYSFDVCILPFKVIPLTLATNPVKVYEYLSAGKPVVSVDLPEIAQCEGLVHVGATHEAFVNHLATELAQAPSRDQEMSRRSFAAGQTWEHRVKQLIAEVEGKREDPLISIIVVTYNNLMLTRTCLASIDTYSDYANIEIIVVDNASSDGSPAYLSDWVKGAANRKLILNTDNRGFAAGNNQGLEIAAGEYLVLLNNDTHVTPGWLRTMVRHLRLNSNIGLIGPVTNNIGNEAKIDISYEDEQQMLQKSSNYVRAHIGKIFRLHTAAFFCVMMPRAIYEQIGPLDEVFGRGFFEDDDYCRRVEQIGKQIACAEDVFIHHHLSASFNKLKSQDRQELFDQNRALYEAKWGAWTPHCYREAGTTATASEAIHDRTGNQSK